MPVAASATALGDEASRPVRLIGPAQTSHRARGHAELAGRVALRQAPIDDVPAAGA